MALAVGVGVIGYFPLYLSVFYDRSNLAGALASYVVIGTVPFILAKAIPGAAKFEHLWFPPARLHWIWFIGMVLALFAGNAIAAILTSNLTIRNDPRLDIPTTSSVVLLGGVLIVIGPIAEEIFWRGYFLEQIRKVTPSAVAVLIQSFLFGLTHLHLHLARSAFIQACLWGVIAGAWRVRFRSLLPLILAHMILNAAVVIPRLKEQYDIAEIAKPFADDLAKQTEKVRTDPKCRQIAALVKKPAPEAVPAIIDYFADPDEDVRTYAMTVLGGCFRREAEPYLKTPLLSRDKNTAGTALSLIGINHYSRYKQEVRDIAWSADIDLATQMSAVVTLGELDDKQGLRTIAQHHPSARIRSMAERVLKR